MELALYCPVYGYYEKEGDTVGRHGDYFTSVSVGSLFGELLASQFAAWLEGGPKTSSETTIEGGSTGMSGAVIVEAGAHHGTLALDILNWMRQWRPALLDRLTYWIVEPSPRRQEWQRRTLAAFGGQVRWASDFHGLRNGHKEDQGGGGVRGIIFCNELLDALPLRRFGWDTSRRCWFEWGVTLEKERFVWTRMPARETVEAVLLLSSQNAGLLNVLPDGYTVEMCPAAADWWRQVAECLGEGKLVAIDYGHTEEEIFMPERAEGTLRAYRGHRSSLDVLADPGEQDITAHVNFSAIQRAGEAAGLSTERLVHQAQFLVPLAQALESEWTPERRRQFQTLIHPEHLGRAFRVLVQSRTVTVSA